MKFSMIVATDSDPLASVPLDGKDAFNTIEEAMEAANRNTLFLIKSYEPGTVEIHYHPPEPPAEIWVKIEVSPLLSKARI